MYKVIQTVKIGDGREDLKREIATCDDRKSADLIVNSLKETTHDPLITFLVAENVGNHLINNIDKKNPIPTNNNIKLDKSTTSSTIADMLSWDITVVEKYSDGSMLVCDPYGSTQFLTPSDFEIYTKNKK
jgi:hypothetical protein